MEGNIFLFHCGEVETAQFYFYIDQQGRICTDGHAGANIITSSFDIEVEIYAYKNELSGWVEDRYYHPLLNADALNLIVTSGFSLIPECSDAYNSWFMNEDSVIQKGTWLHEQSFYLHFYGRNKHVLQMLDARLKNEEII